MMLPHGTNHVLSVSISSFLIGTGLLILTSRVDKRFVAYKFYIVFHLIQPVVVGLFVSLHPYQFEAISTNTTLLLTGSAYTLYYSFLLVPTIGLVVAFMNNTFDSGRTRELAVSYYSRMAGNRLNFLLLIAAIVNISSWFTGNLPGLLGYVLRIFRAAFLFTPLLAGLYFKRSTLVRYAWLFSLGIGLVFSVITGSRGYAFWPLLMYTIGFLIQLRPKKIQLLGWGIFALSLPIGIFVIGFIQQLRSEVGRAPLREANISEVISYVPTALKNTLDRGGEVYLQDEFTGAATGLSRLVDWTLLFAPNMTPEPTPYRGYGDFHHELLGMVAFGGSDLRSSFGTIYPSFMYARGYGFNVNSESDELGRQKSFTVPFAILADSWSRLGLISSVIQILILFLFINFCESLNRRLFKRHPEILVFIFFFLCDISLRFATVYTLTRTIRQTIIFGILTVCVVWLCRQARLKFIPVVFSSSHSNIHKINPRMTKFRR